MPTASSPPSAILTDIEGTTTSIAFVYDVLFPYAAARLERTCGRPDPGPELREALTLLRAEHGQETAADPPTNKARESELNSRREALAKAEETARKEG